jgi:nucleoside-diphosphate-sugar epimerase
MRVTITGATGFVGINLKEYLEKAYAVNSLSMRYVPDQIFKIETDILIHLAGKAHDLKNVSNPNEYYDANFELTKQLFNSFLNSDASVFIFMSTVKAVADEVEGILTEEYKPNPKTHYGIAKLQAEEYILSKKIPNGKRIYILRPCMIHGPGNKGNLNLLYKLVEKELPWPLGAFDNRRSFLTVENLCFVIKEIIENEQIPSAIYNVSDDSTISTNELIKLLGKSLNKKINIWSIPVSGIKGFAKLGDVLPLPLSSERLQKLTENYVVSNKKIIQAIKKPFPISIEDGLIKTFKSFSKLKK